MPSNEQLLTEWTKLKAMIIKQQQELQATKAELAKEKNWWTKWIADDRPLLSCDNFVLFVHQGTGKEFTFRISSSNIILDYETNNNASLTDGKKMIKAIAKWYKKQP